MIQDNHYSQPLLEDLASFYLTWLISPFHMERFIVELLRQLIGVLITSPTK